MDVDSIEPGLDFSDAIQQAVGSSDALLALIGRNWLTATDEAGAVGSMTLTTLSGWRSRRL
jgi:hypothetical protein